MTLMIIAWMKFSFVLNSRSLFPIHSTPLNILLNLMKLKNSIKPWRASLMELSLDYYLVNIKVA